MKGKSRAQRSHRSRGTATAAVLRMDGKRKASALHQRRGSRVDQLTELTRASGSSTRAVVAMPASPADPTAVIQIAYPTRKRSSDGAHGHGAHPGRADARVRELLGAAYGVSAVHEDNAGPGLARSIATARRAAGI
jgi:hypothetical protein